MKCIAVLNPNRTQAMTDAVLRQVRRHLPAGVTAIGVTDEHGPPVIASRATFALAAAAAPRFAAAEGDALLLACFGDPGLEALRAAAAPRPVAGLAEAAMAQAVAERRRFAIVTAGADWVTMLNERVADFGAASWLSGVYALPVHGKQLVDDPEACRPALRDAVLAAQRDGAQALILGGAAFAGLAHLVETELPLIDPTAAATAALLRG